MSKIKEYKEAQEELNQELASIFYLDLNEDEEDF